MEIQEIIGRLHEAGLLKYLLKDRSTGCNIKWRADGDKCISCKDAATIKRRIEKTAEQRHTRTRKNAEVFTPNWVCKKMNDFLDSENPIDDWKDYVNSVRLEITCGEAPYLVSRYDVCDGNDAERIGLLDKKIQQINENVDTENDWLDWVFRAYKATYGYEFQGDNLLIARINLLMAFEEYLRDHWNRGMTYDEYKKLCRIITWNIWQMDGLKGTDRVWLMDWKLLIKRRLGGSEGMKFDFIVGNPPYNDENRGLGNRVGVVYDKFIDNAYSMVRCGVELIHPARFLFNGGGLQSNGIKGCCMINILEYFIMKLIVLKYFQIQTLKVESSRLTMV